MFLELLVGTMSVVGMASAVSALVFFSKQNGHGQRPPEPPLDVPESAEPALPTPAVRVVWPPELAALLTHVAERLEASLVRLESDVAENDKRLTRIASDLSETMAEGMARFSSAISKDPADPAEPPWSGELIHAVEELGEKIAEMAAVEAAPPVIVPPDHTALVESSDRLEKTVLSLPSRIGQHLGDAFSRIKIGGGSGPPPAPPKPAPANLPRITPGMQPSLPQIPASYVGGSIYAPAGEVASLLLLIQLQLSPNCPGTSAEFSLSADSTVYVGAASALGGPLTATNYAFQLAPGDPPRIYRSSYPGNNTPVGELQVLAPTGGYLHVEVQS